MNYGSIAMCAIDFIRALRQRGKIIFWVFRIIVGKYAYREFELLSMFLEIGGANPTFDYGLEDMDYHKKSMEELRKGWIDEIS